jgi:hypothetical protein
MMNGLNIRPFIAFAALVLLPFLMGPGACNTEVNLGKDRGGANAGSGGGGAVEEESAGSEVGGEESHETAGEGGEAVAGRTHEKGGAGAGGVVDAGAGREKWCGGKFCGTDEVCCYESCELCPLPPFCSKQECPSSGPKSCDQYSGCAKGQYCEIDSCGRNGETGTCMSIPSDCQRSRSDEPVCGCDDKPYGSECAAHAYGTAVAYKGDCGVICSPGYADCDRDRFCETDLTKDPYHCGDCRYSCFSGSCVNGVCTAGEPCGGSGKIICPAGKYCDVSFGDGCYATDARGYCLEQPQPETCSKSCMPVCGCDNKTYDNGCIAASAGISILDFGPCMPPVCTYGDDRTCNEDPSDPPTVSLHGKCQCDGTCVCEQGYRQNQRTGRCL